MNHHPFLVGLEAGRFHAPPHQPVAVGTPYGVHIVAEVAFGEVGGCAAGEVVDEDVGVGAFGERLAALTFAAVGDLGAVGAPHGLLHSSERWDRAVEALAFQQLGGLFGFVHGCDEEVGVGAVGPCVPVAVHQIVVDHGVGFWQVGVAILDSGVEAHVAGVEQVLAVGRVGEPVDVRFRVGDLGAVAAVGVALENLHHAVGGVEEGDLLPVGPPDGLCLTGRRGGDLCRFAAGHRNSVEFGIAFVLGIVEIFHRIEQRLTVGRHLWCGNAAEIPQDFLREHALREVGHGAVVAGDEVAVGVSGALLVLAGYSHSQKNCNKNESFLHIYLIDN